LDANDSMSLVKLFRLMLIQVLVEGQKVVNYSISC